MKKDLLEALKIGLLVSIPMSVVMLLLLWAGMLICDLMDCPPPPRGW